MSEGLLANMSADIIALPFISITRLIQALGGLIIIYLVFSIVNAVINWKKNKEIKKMGKNIEEIKKLLSEKKGKRRR